MGLAGALLLRGGSANAASSEWIPVSPLTELPPNLPEPPDDSGFCDPKVPDDADEAHSCWRLFGADLNADGREDLIATWHQLIGDMVRGQSPYREELYAYRNTGNGYVRVLETNKGFGWSVFVTGAPGCRDIVQIAPVGKKARRWTCNAGRYDAKPKAARYEPRFDPVAYEDCLRCCEGFGIEKTPIGCFAPAIRNCTIRGTIGWRECGKNIPAATRDANRKSCPMERRKALCEPGCRRWATQ